MATRHLAKFSIGLISLTLLLWNFPARHDPRHYDERPYISGSLQLLEGMIPEYKYSPAGPQTWAGWAYGGAMSAMRFVRPGEEERAVPVMVRPFIAVNNAMFDIYRDMGTLRWVWVIFAIPFVVWAAVSGFNIGFDRAGLAGGILGGGIVAMLPILIEVGGEARPYAMGWSLAVIALDYAIVRRNRPRWTTSAIFFGLAVATRIDMLMIAPLFWSELWARRRESLMRDDFHAGAERSAAPAPSASFPRSFLRFHLIAATTALLVSPWILTNIIGNLRIIATVRLADPTTGPIPLAKTLTDLAWTNGLALIIPLVLFGIWLRRPGERWPRIFLALFVALAVLSMLKATGFGLQHQGGPIVIVLATCTLALAPLVRRWPAIAWAVVAVALALPLYQSAKSIHARRSGYIADGSAPWVEANIPPGTVVYAHASLRDPLPTVESSDVLWKEVNDHPNWQKKFLAGMQRFNLSADSLPRALSDENMLVERGNRRRIFILGSRPGIGPRYDYRLVDFSQALGALDPSLELPKTGGVVIWRASFPLQPGQQAEWQRLVDFAGDPVASWKTEARGTFVFVSPDLRAKLNLPAAGQ